MSNLDKSEELLACPFCGGAGKFYADHYVSDDLTPSPVIECQGCDAWVPAKSWNTRTHWDAGTPVHAISDECAHSYANQEGCPECGCDFADGAEMQKALEMLILFTNPRPGNAVALANAYRAIHAFKAKHSGKKEGESK